MSVAGGLHQKLLDIERKLRDLNFGELSLKNRKNSSPAVVAASPVLPGSMTSPMPRRQTPVFVLPGKDDSTPLDAPAIRRRRPYPQEWFASPNRQSDGAETQNRLEEIMKQTGVLRLNGKEFKLNPSDLKCVEYLGKGTSGDVYEMLHAETNTTLAVKQMRRSGNKEELKRIIMDLDVVLRSHECPFIVRCYGCFITDCEVWICMELMATCLDKLSKRINAGIPECILGKLTVSIVKALNYLKETQTVIHRDVKPSNILLDWDGTVKLCDFGISGRLVDSKAKTRNAGCLAYMAPERIEPSNSNYDIRADVWSLGISLVELAQGKFPYVNCKTDFEVLAKIVQEEPPCLTVEQGFSPMFCEFVKNCLIKDFNKRPRFRDLLKSDFIRHYEATNVDVACWFRRVMQETPV